MKSLFTLIIMSYSSLGFSYCRGKEVHYKDGKVLEFSFEEEYEKKAKYINRLDYYEVTLDKKRMTISKDGELKIDNISIKLPKKQFKYTEFYSLTKVNDKYFIRMGFDDGVDILVNYLVEIDIKNKKYQSVWTEPCSHWKTYLSRIEGKLTYMCEYYCSKHSESKINSIFQYKKQKWDSLKKEKYCAEFGKHQKIVFTSFKRILKKDKSGVRYTTEWIKPDKTDCILAKPVSDEDVKRRMREDAKLIEEFRKKK